jgi:tripartite-type tricarboxylate transporter receptor subunit TctC
MQWEAKVALATSTLWSKVMLFRLATALVFCSMASAAWSADAQSSSQRAVTLVVPFPSGGPTDAIGRVMAEGLQAQLGQSVIVENAPGATGSIGTGKVARAEADGHMLILGTVATHVFNGAAYPLKYDVIKDFEPISLVASDPQIIAVRKELPVADLAQLIGWLKANPDHATAGTAGVGSTSHVNAVRFQALTGTQLGSSHTAAVDLRCVIWSPAISISCSISQRILCRRFARAVLKRSR